LMVGAFGLGGGQAPLERAVKYAKTRQQFGAPIFEKEGYRLKLLVENWVDLAAGRAYAEQTALTIDNGATDLATEGSIAKYWCTEAGNRAADSAIQALGGYGYTREYLVEKMRRDVRITTIYEGTSEIQQSIIGMFRWKETVRSKGAFYEELAVQMDEVHASNPDVGGALVAGALRGLNDTVQFMHASRSTRHQIVMFTMADMMTACEVAAAMVKKAATHVADGHAQAEYFAAMSRIMARKAARMVIDGVEKCAGGLVEADDSEALAGGEDLRTAVRGRLPLSLTAGLWNDMNLVGEMLDDLV
jgi:alkylation response protein AidB-like acyl-CoA dehydrogenase